MSENLEQTLEQETAPEMTEKEELLAYVMDKTGLTMDVINQWKKQHGKNNVHVLPLDDESIYIFRSILRLEYRSLTARIKALEKENDEQKNELYAESLVQQCMLYPKVTADFTTACPAGLIGTLREAIEIKSAFVPTAVLLNSLATL